MENFSGHLTKVGFVLDEYDLILVKPNFCGLYHPSLDLIAALVQYLEGHAGKVIIGETRSMMHTPREQFEKLGIEDLSKRFGDQLELKDLSEENSLKIEVENPRVIENFEIPETVVDCDLLINVTKVGIHSLKNLTNALKNIFGLLSDKHKSGYHSKGMDKVIADLAKVVRLDLNNSRL